MDRVFELLKQRPVGPKNRRRAVFASALPVATGIVLAAALVCLVGGGRAFLLPVIAISTGWVVYQSGGLHG